MNSSESGPFSKPLPMPPPLSVTPAMQKMEGFSPISVKIVVVMGGEKCYNGKQDWERMGLRLWGK